MNTFKNIYNFFSSLRTALWLLLALLCLFFYGSFIMPLKVEFQSVHSAPLLDWLTGNTLSVTWWLWGAIGILSILTANTLLCSIEAIVKKRKAKQWLLIIAPQVIHIGFLFILLAHLLSSLGSFKGTAFAYKNSVFRLSNGFDVMFEKIETNISPAGHIKYWYADIKYFKEGRYIISDVIKPNNPSLHEGLGIYIKHVEVAPFPVAHIEVSREPGAVWALIGGVLFISGVITLLILKIKREDVQGWEKSV
jgi:hypothetical protein